MRNRTSSRFVIEQHDDGEVRPYIEQLMNAQNASLAQPTGGQNNELYSSAGFEVEQNEESETREVHGPTLLKDIWDMSPGKTIVVQFNNRNQAIGKEGQKLASFLGIVARTPELAPLNVDDWRSFDKEKKKQLVKFVKKKFSIPTRGEEFVKKSIGKKWKDFKCDLKSTYMTKYKTKNALLKNRPARIPSDQWIGLVSYWLSDKAKKRSQANRSNRAKQKMPHTGGSKSIATLMNEMAVDGIEPTRAQVFLLTHKKRKDGRPLDKTSANIIDKLNEKLSTGESSNEQHPRSVAWEGDVYSQVLGNDSSGYVRGLGLGPTPARLWGSKSSLRNFATDDSSNEAVQRLEQEIKELKEKHNGDMTLMKQNQDKLLSELSWMRQVMCKIAPVELSMPQNFNGNSAGQASDSSSGYGQAP